MLASSASAQVPSLQRREASRLVAIDPDPHLEHAVTLVLTSWHVDVVTAAGPTPGRDFDDAIRTGHRIARGSQARAVVWISHDTAHPDLHSLWVYDDRSHTIAVRPLSSPPPYDDATAAAIALTVKTLLANAFEGAPNPPELPDEEPRVPTAPAKPTAPHVFRLHTLGGVRVPTNASDSLAARFGAELTYFPPYFRGFGLAIGVEAGPSVLVDHEPYFVGTFTDTIALMSLKWRIPLRPWFAFEIGAGPGLHFSAIEGSAPALGLSGRVTRTDVSLETLLGIELAWKTLRVAPLVGTSFLVHYQHYRVNTVQVLDVPPGQMLYGLRVGVELP